jgi:hypothetical protein
MNNRDIEKAKAHGDYRLAGQMARLIGTTDHYGCHFGMRSTRDLAIDEFKAGWREIDNALTEGARP